MEFLKIFFELRLVDLLNLIFSKSIERLIWSAMVLSDVIGNLLLYLESCSVLVLEFKEGLQTRNEILDDL